MMWWRSVSSSALRVCRHMSATPYVATSITTAVTASVSSWTSISPWRTLAVGGAVASGEHDHRDRPRRGVGLELAADVEPGGPLAFLEVHVEKHRVRGVFAGEVERFFRGRGFSDRPPLRGERDPDHVTNEAVVVGDEDVCHPILCGGKATGVADRFTALVAPT